MIFTPNHESLSLSELLIVIESDADIIKEVKTGLFVSFNKAYQADSFQNCIESMKCDFKRHGNKILILN